MFLWISVFNYPCLYGYPFGYPWISMDIHALTCYPGRRRYDVTDWRSKVSDCNGEHNQHFEKTALFRGAEKVLPILKNRYCGGSLRSMKNHTK